MYQSLRQRIPVSYRRALGQLLREMRVESGLSQVELAEKLGVHQSFVTRVEQGERQLSLLEMRLICQTLSHRIEDVVERLEHAIRSEEDRTR